ncbi:MAG: AMP-binding protein, partial [Armatimonadetes bacterium]|nr:AMP-binding protein [Armatimonadota bacterium]
LVNLLSAQITAFGLGRGRRSLFYLSTSFDASLSDMGTALLSGATLVIDPTVTTLTPDRLLERLGELRITHLDLPPALLRLLDPERAPACLETLILGGEPCPPAVVRRWAAGRRFLNVYGPTDGTICTSLCRCDSETWTRPLIGDPIPGITYRLLDAEGAPAAAGREAELWIGGIGVARGYHRRPELDAARFHRIGDERFFRTGDRVLQQVNGKIEFLGRLDRQIKVRGQLAAPEEIEAALQARPEVRQAAVALSRVGPEREVLTAYVVPSGDVSPAALLRALAERLPKWLLPQRLEFLPELPLTASGKVDLAALAARTPAARSSGREPIPAVTAAERELVAIWEKVLGTGPIGVTDDFLEAGGDSLAALQAAAEAERRGLEATPAAHLTQRTIQRILANRDSGDGPDTRAVLSAAVLRAEVAPDAEWEARLATAAARGGAAPPAAEPQRILLTGATGFLGARLLRELLSRTEAEIFCLIRAAGETDARRRIRAAVEGSGPALTSAEAERVRCRVGDLTVPRFGLAAREWDRLALDVDTIHHCAAQVHSLLPYSALRAVNLGGTREVVRLLCDGRRKRLHFASTLSVFVATDRNQGLLEETDYLERTGWVYGGYAQSKWAAERFLHETRGQAGPIAVYRFGLLTGDVQTGRAGDRDLLTLFWRGIAACGCLPVRADQELWVDITPVDYAAAAMAHLSLRAVADETSVFHVANPRSASAADLAAALRAAGATVQETDWATWRSRLEEGTAGEGNSAAYLALCRCFPEPGAFERHRSV